MSKRELCIGLARARRSLLRKADAERCVARGNPEGSHGESIALQSAARIEGMAAGINYTVGWLGIDRKDWERAIEDSINSD